MSSPTHDSDPNEANVNHDSQESINEKKEEVPSFDDSTTAETENMKRKRDDDLDNSQKISSSSDASKKIKTEGAVTKPDSNKEISSVTGPDGTLTEVIEIAPDKVGQVIGSRGAVIQEMQARSGCRIFVNQDFPAGVNRQVTFTGNTSQVKAARELVRLIIEEGPTAIHMLDGPVLIHEMDCPQSLVGRIIGGSGATIKELQNRCAVKIQINQNFPDGAPRKITITGNNAAVQNAIQLITYVMEHGPTLPPPGHMNSARGYGNPPHGGMYGNPQIPDSPSVQIPGVTFHPIETLPVGGQQQIMTCPKSLIGRIIGRGGENINMVQSRSGCRLQVDQNVPEGQPCKVSIVGTTQGILMADQLLQDIMLNAPGRGGPAPQNYQGMGFGQPPQQHQHPMAGGAPGGYYGNRGGMTGGMAMGNQQPPYGVGGGGMSSQYGGFPSPSNQFGGPPGAGMGFPMQGQGGMYGPMMGGASSYGGGGAGGGMPPQQQGGMYGMQAGSYGAPAAGASGNWQQQQQPVQQVQHSPQYQQQVNTYGTTMSKPPPSIPPGWAEHKTDDGTSYWYNSTTGISQVFYRLDMMI